MPETTIYFFRDSHGGVPVMEWLEDLADRNSKAHKKCLAYLLHLRAEGHRLDRPIAATLRDGIYELRPSYQGVHYRILYGFAGQSVVVLLHGITKEKRVPSVEIDKALARLNQFKNDPERYSFPEFEIDG